MQPSDPRPIPHLTRFATMFAGRWTRVKVLWIRECDWRAIDVHPKTFLYLTSFSSVTTLSLKEVMFPNVATFGRLILALPSLQSLECLRLGFVDYRLDPRTFPNRASGMKLSRLHLWASVNFFVITGIIANIHELYLGSDTPFKVGDVKESDVQRLLQGLATSLRVLSFSRNVGGSERDLTTGELIGGDDLDLSKNVSLEWLSLYSYADHGWVPKLLSTVTCDHIREVYLALHTQEDSELSYASTMNSMQKFCLDMDTVLSLPVFTNLRHVGLIIWPPEGGWDESWKVSCPQAIRQYTTKLHAKGILSVTAW